MGYPHGVFYLLHKTIKISVPRNQDFHFHTKNTLQERALGIREMNPIKLFVVSIININSTSKQAIYKKKKCKNLQCNLFLIKIKIVVIVLVNRF